MHKAKDQSPLSKVALMLALGLYVSSASGQVTIFGGADCGQWIAEKTFARKSWLIGFLSGMNATYEGKNKDPLKALNSPDQAFLWMDNWCNRNPLEKIAIGGQILFLELAEKKR